MPHVKMHFDGWIALPEAVRRKLHLATGAELEAELVGDGVMLRRAPAREAKTPARPATDRKDGDSAASGSPTAAAEPPPAAAKERKRAAAGGEAAGAERRADAPAAAPRAAPTRSRLRAALLPVPRTRGRKAAMASGAGHG
jgi:bifunctional DNA-binding transcriptional regulator/antitoxin component of YhaV-PrlF toxin-antitoxin module